MEKVIERMSEASAVLSKHKTSAMAIYKLYREKAASIRSTYAESVAAERIANLKSNTRAELKTLENERSEALKGLAQEMRYALFDLVAQEIPVSFIHKLQLYREYELPIRETDVRALIVAADGRFPALQVLAKAVEKDGYKIKLPSVEELENDIQAFTRAANHDSMYVPDEYIQEGIQIYPHKPYIDDDGIVTNPTFDNNSALYMTLCRSAFANVEKRLAEDEAPKRWQGANRMHYDAKKKEPYATKDRLAEVQAETDLLASIVHADNAEIEHIFQMNHAKPMPTLEEQHAILARYM